MAKFKKTAKKTAGKPASRPSRRSRPSTCRASLSESAQQIWLAGVGAFGRAQAEGTKLFEGPGQGRPEPRDRPRASSPAARPMPCATRSRTKVGQARERAADTWDRLEKVFEDRVQRALVKLGVPGRDDLAELSRARRHADRRTAPAGRQAARPRPRQAAVRKARCQEGREEAAPRKAVAQEPAAKKAARKPAAAPQRLDPHR